MHFLTLPPPHRRTPCNARHALAARPHAARTTTRQMLATHSAARSCERLSSWQAARISWVLPPTPTRRAATPSRALFDKNGFENRTAAAFFGRGVLTPGGFMTVRSAEALAKELGRK